MKPVFFICILGCLLFGCDSGRLFSEREELLKSFPRIEKLAAEPFIEDQIGIVSMAVIDRYIVLFFQGNPERKLFVVYDRQGRQLGSFGDKGRGPNELLNNIYLDQYYLNDSSQVVMWVCDVSDQKLHAVNIDRSLRARTNCIERTVGTLPMAGSSFVMDDSSVLAVQPSMQNYYLKRLAPFSREVTDSRPLFRKDIPGGERIYNTTWKLSPDRKWLITASMALDQLYFYSLTGEEHRTVSVFREPKASEMEVDPETGLPKMYSYGDIVCCGDLIFSTYFGIPYDDFGTTGPGRTGIVHVFDDEGRGVCELHTDPYIYTVSVDTEQGYMYGLDFEERVYRFDIKKLLDSRKR